MTDPFPIARTAGGVDILFSPAVANRHGLITGATGTGKTVSLQVLADYFSAIGVPVFLSDVKGDLSGLAAAGSLTPKMKERLAATGVPEPAWRAIRSCSGTSSASAAIPVRATISDLGPLILGRLLGINPTQQGVLTMSFKIADDAGLLLLDLKDLRAMLAFVGENAGEFRTEVRQRLGGLDRRHPAGAARARTAGRRPVLRRADARCRRFAPDRQPGPRRGQHSRRRQSDQPPEGLRRVPAVDPLRLFERLPEIGDADKPRLIFFFDEAHLLFTDAPDALVEKIEQVVRLIRSKGVGVYFVTHSPADLPDNVKSQLGHRIQHALRAFTPKDQKAVRAAAETLRPNPAIDMERAISELAVGEALVSLLDAKGTPAVTERAWIAPPSSQIGPIPDAERERLRSESARTFGHYDWTVDCSCLREAHQPDGGTGRPRRHADRCHPGAACRHTRAIGLLVRHLFITTGPRGGRREGVIEAAAKSAARSVGSSLGRAIMRGTLGGLLGGSRR